MAKNNCGLKLRLIHLIIILLTLFGSGVAAWVWQRAETKAIAKDTASLSTDGCEPARLHTTQIAVIETQLKTMQTEQREAFKEILTRLPK